ncbi:MAG: class I SAM-dependent methyltransferase [Candidatus Woesearchaeota archaeon]
MINNNDVIKNNKIKGDWADNFVQAWKYYTGSARASKADLELIKSMILQKIKENKEKCLDICKFKILILGSTSEYRNLCAELNIACACFDYSKFNFEYLKEEIINLPEETLINDNWLTHVINEKFDIILGDVVINQMKKEDVPLLLKNISLMLKPNGLFMPRVHIKEDGERYSPEKAVDEYRKLGNPKPIYNYLMRNMYIAGYDFEQDYVLLDNVYAAGKHAFDKGLLTAEEFEIFDLCDFKDRKKYLFYIPTRNDIIKFLNEYFEIIDTFYGAECQQPEVYPLFVLKKK